MTTPEERKQIVSMIRQFVERDIKPVVSELEHKDEYPFAIVEKMKELGLFGVTIPEKYGGLGLDATTYAMIVEEICKGWMSISGLINTHLIMAYTVYTFGTEEQKQRLLPAMARGEKRGGLALTEPHAGTDVQNIKTTAVRRGNDYVINGTKMFITNARYGNTFALLAVTDPEAKPRHRGMSCFIVEKGHPGFQVSRDIHKLGYRGIETCELIFEEFLCPAENLVGLQEGEGFRHIMSGLELGRINIAARAVGVATEAFETAIKYSQQRHTMGKPICEHQAIQLKLADMYTKLTAARLLTYHAAEKKDTGQRLDLESGMAKLFSSEMALEVSTEAMRILGGYGYTDEFPVERCYRDAPLMIIGEGTNEILRTVIARNLVNRFRIEE